MSLIVPIVCLGGARGAAVAMEYRGLSCRYLYKNHTGCDLPCYSDELDHVVEERGDLVLPCHFACTWFKRRDYERARDYIREQRALEVLAT